MYREDISASAACVCGASRAEHDPRRRALTPRRRRRVSVAECGHRGPRREGEREAQVSGCRRPCRCRRRSRRLRSRAGGPKTKLVSRASNGDPAANGYSYPGGITPNGRWVPFESDADNLPGATGDYQVYVRDRKTGSTKLVSKSNSGDPGDERQLRRVDLRRRPVHRLRVLRVQSARLAGSHLPSGLRPRPEEGHHEAGQQAGRWRSGDRRIQQRRLDLGQRAPRRFRVGREQPPGQPLARRPGLPKDRKTGALKLISKTSGGTPANEDSEDPAISPNGRIVGFESESTNLPGGLGGGDDEIYVRDFEGGRDAPREQEQRGRSGQRRHG